ncbi:anaerobic glycerol-3-phosphate dehydrogenase subunit GlpA, partial [Desulfovibrio sp.]
MKETTVIIIGGGATGIGILRDLSMRGVPALLLEQGGLAHGTSSRFHGLLHSGARYAVSDSESARECIEENMILRRIGKQCVEETEGFFVRTKLDDPAFEPGWVEACARAGISAERIDVAEARRLEPNLAPNICSVYRVPDSCVDGFRLVWHNALCARRYGGDILTYHEVIAIKQSNGKVTGVTARNRITGEELDIACEYVVNAAGSWSGQIAQLAGLDVSVSPDRGTLIVFNHRFTSRVVNRLHKSSDGDIFVPHGSITILGTTSTPTDRPDNNTPTTEDVLRLLDIGEPLFPDLRSYRILRAFAGTRPLYTPNNAVGRAASRNFHIVDHKQDGLEGMASIFGGKLTTYRLMAERMSDLVCRYLGNNEPCRTAEEPIMEDPSPELMQKAAKVFPLNGAVLAADRLGS